jgi:hypothetical protein
MLDILKSLFEKLTSTEAAAATAAFLAALIPIVLKLVSLLKLDVKKLPRWAQPIPAAVMALAVALLEQLQGGGTIWDALLVLVFGFLGGVGLYHTTKRVVPRLPKAQTPTMTKTASTTLILTVLLTAGCAGSFEEARAAGLKARSPTRVAAVAPSDQCRAYDSGHRTWDAVAKGAAVLAGAQGLGQIPVDTKGARIGLAAGTAVAATGAIVAESLASGYAESWARECQ